MHCLFNGNAFTKPTIYYMSNTNNLQLYRNDVYFNDKETAKLALESQLKTSSDGELVISRYAVKDKMVLLLMLKHFLVLQLMVLMAFLQQYSIMMICQPIQN